MWIVCPQSVTHCQRRLAAKFQFINQLRKTDKQIEKLFSPPAYPLTCQPEGMKISVYLSTA